MRDLVCPQVEELQVKTPGESPQNPFDIKNMGKFIEH